MAIEGILQGSIARSVNSTKIQQVLLSAKPRHVGRGEPTRHIISRRPVLHSIFISYRRDDSEGEAGRLCDDLAEIFHEESVFMDVNAIQPGRDFRKAIDESIHKCSVLLAIVGQGWLDSKDGSGQKRLDDTNDFVRLEIASALVRDIPVIPVLVRGAKMPRAEQLPADLRELAYRNAVELTHARWRSDLQVLIRALRPYMKAPDQEISRDNLSEDGAISRATISIPRPDVQAPPAASPRGMEGADLQQVIRELAAYIGPIAEVVVKRAAKRATSLTDLCGKVAQQIDVSADRAKFLASCQRAT
jgi:TIR domain